MKLTGGAPQLNDALEVPDLFEGRALVWPAAYPWYVSQRSSTSLGQLLLSFHLSSWASRAILPAVPNLPHSESVIVDRRKLTDYLLSSSHPLGRAKAKFLARLGYTQLNVDELDAALRQIAQTPDSITTQGTLHGPISPARIRTVWIVDRGSEIPRLVTAYPGD